MLMQDVHSCAQVLAENEKLKRYIRKVKKENEEMKSELTAFQEQKKIDTLLKAYVTTRDSSVQTDPSKSAHTSLSQQSKAKSDRSSDSSERLNKMIILHNNLMKRYEKELRVNMENVESITTLSLRVNELEQKLKESKFQVEKLEREKRRKSWGISADGEGSCKSDISGLLQELDKVRKERDKLQREKKKFKEELSGLDQGFFDEIEDIKFALQQSASLNKEYDRSLRKICSRFGVPFPHPGRQKEPVS